MRQAGQQHSNAAGRLVYDDAPNPYGVDFASNPYGRRLCPKTLWASTLSQTLMGVDYAPKPYGRRLCPKPLWASTLPQNLMGVDYAPNPYGRRLCPKTLVCGFCHTPLYLLFVIGRTNSNCVKHDDGDDDGEVEEHRREHSTGGANRVGARTLYSTVLCCEVLPSLMTHKAGQEAHTHSSTHTHARTRTHTHTLSHTHTPHTRARASHITRRPYPLTQPDPHMHAPTSSTNPPTHMLTHMQTLHTPPSRTR